MEEPMSCDKKVFGLATVQPNRAIKKCRIRKLMIEYILCPEAVILTVPRSCGVCERRIDCIDDFIIQIIIKTSKNDDATRGSFVLP